MVNHVRYVRPTVSLMRAVQDSELWKTFDARAIELINFGRSSFTQKDWNTLYSGVDKAVDAPFLTRIPWSCPSQFQLAPNVNNLSGSRNIAIAAPPSHPSALLPVHVPSKPAQASFAQTLNLVSAASPAQSSFSNPFPPRDQNSSSLLAARDRGSASGAESAAAGYITAGGDVAITGGSLAAASSALLPMSGSPKLTCASSTDELRAAARKVRAPWDDTSKHTLWQILGELGLQNKCEHKQVMVEVIQHPVFPLKTHYNILSSNHLKSLKNICSDLIRLKNPAAAEAAEEAQRSQATAHKKKRQARSSAARK
jgi:hypothetical protein